MNACIYATVEHFYQVWKFKDHSVTRETIRCSATPFLARQFGKRFKPLRDDWEEVKVKIMREALVHKFTQNRGLITQLYLTKGKQLIEHSRDAYWGDGLNGRGKNMLGKLLMELRKDSWANI